MPDFGIMVVEEFNDFGNDLLGISIEQNKARLAEVTSIAQLLFVNVRRRKMQPDKPNGRDARENIVNCFRWPAGNHGHTIRGGSGAELADRISGFEFRLKRNKWSVGRILSEPVGQASSPVNRLAQTKQNRGEHGEHNQYHRRCDDKASFPHANNMRKTRRN